MAKGKVKWYNADKGFGFIRPDDGGNDVFVHRSALEAAGMHGLKDDLPIEFDVEEDRSGKDKACNLKVI